MLLLCFLSPSPPMTATTAEWPYDPAAIVADGRSSHPLLTARRWWLRSRERKRRVTSHRCVVRGAHENRLPRPQRSSNQVVARSCPFVAPFSQAVVRASHKKTLQLPRPVARCRSAMVQTSGARLHRRDVAMFGSDGSRAIDAERPPDRRPKDGYPSAFHGRVGARGAT